MRVFFRVAERHSQSQRKLAILPVAHLCFAQR